mmetsp:Transcript_92997/g.164413  ORF Transcript_92997/g.164413 Transcript_92997/m.164413 type:complete len:91 (-) Transcript_92997:1257-1529(-)
MPHLIASFYKLVVFTILCSCGHVFLVGIQKFHKDVAFNEISQASTRSSSVVVDARHICWLDAFVPASVETELVPASVVTEPWELTEILLE